MRTVGLGRTGLKISEICLGTMTFGLQTDRGESFDIMDAAEYLGIDFFDVADVYPVGGMLEPLRIAGALITGTLPRPLHTAVS